METSFPAWKICRLTAMVIIYLITPVDMEKKKLNGFKSRTQKVFHSLLKKHNLSHCSLPGVKSSSAHRMFNGDGLPTVRVLETIAPLFGDDAAFLTAAWMEDKLDQMPKAGKGVRVEVE
jgi:hypothetical protein